MGYRLGLSIFLNLSVDHVTLLLWNHPWLLPMTLQGKEVQALSLMLLQCSKNPASRAFVHTVSPAPHAFLPVTIRHILQGPLKQHFLFPLNSPECFDCIPFFFFKYSRFLLVIYFIHISVYMSIPISQFITPPPPPSPPLSPLGIHMFVLYICVSISAMQTGSSVPFF